jgi:hypothetical protein
LVVHTVVELDILETEASAFERQQTLLEGKAAGIADETTGCADDAVAWDDQRGWVGADGLPDGARGGGVADLSCQLPIRQHGAVGDRGHGVPDRELERSAAEVER